MTTFTDGIDEWRKQYDANVESQNQVAQEEQVNEWQRALDEQNKQEEEAQQQKQQELMNQMQTHQQGLLNEMSSVVQRAKVQNARRQLDFNTLMAGAIKSSFDAGGQLPEVARNFMNRRMGFDGVKTGVIGGKRLPDGGYGFVFADGVDNNGQVITQTQIFDKPSLYGMMKMNPNLFSRLDVVDMQNLLLNNGMSMQELAQYDKLGQYGKINTTRDSDHINNQIVANGSGANGRQVGSTISRKGFLGDAPDRQRSPISTFAADGNGGFSRRTYHPTGEVEGSDWGTRDPNYQGKWKVLESNEEGKRYYNDKTGDEAFVKNGETPPWMSYAKDENARKEQARQFDKKYAEEARQFDATNAREWDKNDLKAQELEDKYDQFWSAFDQSNYQFDKTQEMEFAKLLYAKPNNKDELKLKMEFYQKMMEPNEKYGGNKKDGFKSRLDYLTPMQKNEFWTGYNNFVKWLNENGLGADKKTTPKKTTPEMSDEEKKKLADDFMKSYVDGKVTSVFGSRASATPSTSSTGVNNGDKAKPKKSLDKAKPKKSLDDYAGVYAH